MEEKEYMILFSDGTDWELLYNQKFPYQLMVEIVEKYHNEHPSWEFQIVSYEFSMHCLED